MGLRCPFKQMAQDHANDVRIMRWCRELYRRDNNTVHEMHVRWASLSMDYADYVKTFYRIPTADEHSGRR